MRDEPLGLGAGGHITWWSHNCDAFVFEERLRALNDEDMFKPRHDELHCFLQWRRQTRFIRHHGGPIMAVTLFFTCLWFVWRACESRRQTEDLPQVETLRMHELDRKLQVAQMPRL